jgi:hypothetical protein
MTICVVEDCGRKVRARGWCVTHYERWRQHGDPKSHIPVVSRGCWERTPESNANSSAARRGRKQSEETKLRRSFSMIGHLVTEETRTKISEKKKQRDAQEAIGFFIDQYGYRRLTGQQGHPLSSRVGQVLEHRVILYNKIGPGPHPCYWHSLSGCGQLALEWPKVCVDHLDDDPLNNDPDNLVSSCRGCNWGRSIRSWYTGITTCSGCGDTWTDLNLCHCSICHYTFKTPNAFGRHRHQGK